MLDMNEYFTIIKNLNISIIYSGPMWTDGLRGLSEMVKANLAVDDLPGSAAKSIFSVFVEQATNVAMYSAEKERFPQRDEDPIDVSAGMLILGNRDKIYFIQTRNAVRDEQAEFIKSKIDYLNSLDKKEIRRYYRERLRSDNDNPESQGGGLGLIEIARRASAPIKYAFERIDEQLSNFTMYVEIGQTET